MTHCFITCVILLELLQVGSHFCAKQQVLLQCKYVIDMYPFVLLHNFEYQSIYLYARSQDLYSISTQSPATQIQVLTFSHPQSRWHRPHHKFQIQHLWCQDRYNRLKCPRLGCPPTWKLPIRVVITPYRFIFLDRYDPCYSIGGRTI